MSEFLDRLVNPSKHHAVTILDTEFQMHSMSVREKFSVLEEINSFEPKVKSFDQMIDTLCHVIHSINSDEDVKKILNEVERFDDLMKIVNGVVDYCSFKDDESKNSVSSSDTSTPALTGK